MSRRFSILVTAGPTREKIDPVRFISNYSTGVFGYEIAKEARRRGVEVTLVSGPVALKRPRGVKFISVESAVDMMKVLRREIKRADCLIMAAAVSDWRVLKKSGNKIKRGDGAKELKLVENPDILSSLDRGKNKIFVGFALETENLEKNALKKLKEKRLDIIVANMLGGGKEAFGDNLTNILIIDRFGGIKKASGMTKKGLAKIILDKVFNFKI